MYVFQKMQHRHMFASVLLACAFFFAGCAFDFGNRNNEEEQIVEAKRQSYAVKPVQGKKAYAVLLNPTLTPLKNIRYVADATGVSGFNAPPTHRSANVDMPKVTLPQNTHFRPKDGIQEFLAANKKGARFAMPAIENPVFAVTPITPVVDTTTKDIYIDTKIDITTGSISYEKKRATLKYGSGSTKCYVWLVDDYKGVVTEEQCKKVGETFDETYELVREVFGNESDKLIPFDAQTIDDFKPMTDYSDTGTKVNIVLYDIAPDASAITDEQKANGVQGYFSGKDYYAFDKYNGKEETYSNKGKYFYVDAYAVKINPKECYSTLVHEFQHMIHLNQKTFSSKKSGGIATATWFNEMLSLLCEDALKEKINPGTPNGLQGRLQNFNQYYWLSGIEYNTEDSSSAVIAYATLYTFGAYLARTYGGIDLIKEMSTNAYADEAAIIEAIKSCGHSTTAGGKQLAMAQLLREFADDVLVGAASSGLKKNVAWSESPFSYTYPLMPLDLCSDSYAWKNGTGSGKIDDELFYNNVTGSGTFTGPLIFRPNARLTGRPLRPYGFLFYYLGTTDGSGQITLDISKGAANQEIVLVYEE